MMFAHCSSDPRILAEVLTATFERKLINTLHSHSGIDYVRILEPNSMLDDASVVATTFYYAQTFSNNIAMTFGDIAQAKSIITILENGRLFITKWCLRRNGMLEKVLGHGFQDCLGRTPTHIALDAGYCDRLRREDVNVQDVLGRTPLHIACKEVKSNAIQKLIDLGASAAMQTITGMTPAHVIASLDLISLRQRFSYVKMLLMQWRDVWYVQDSAGCTVLDAIEVADPLLWSSLRSTDATYQLLSRL
ncbi:hypothetical protein EJ04DRAFT_136727 [Polyplosphaeria fusca]|uniref:Uncharacterized protein n=1 Tax=Polyplosphaeria fusca TaxID=682080 RepID=A0A9P4QHR7_9PLEO|nr:hypothetical protein EJ04DRAFT_136727 [Polyplosphaeria fusca]